MHNGSKWWSKHAKYCFDQLGLTQDHLPYLTSNAIFEFLTQFVSGCSYYFSKQYDNFEQACSQDWFGGVRDSKKVDLLDLKSGLFEPHSPLPSYKNPMFGQFCGWKWTFWHILGVRMFNFGLGQSAISLRGGLASSTSRYLSYFHHLAFQKPLHRSILRTVPSSQFGSFL